MRFRSKSIISLAVFVGLALMVGVVSAGKWISVGDGTQAIQLDKACKDGFRVIGAYVRSSAPSTPTGQYPSQPYDLPFYARLYSKVIDIVGPDAVDLIVADPANNPPTPILAQASVHIQERATSITVVDNFRGFSGETTWWGTADIPWSAPLNPAYPYIAMFYTWSPNYAFGFLNNPGGLQNCYLFPPDAKNDRFSTRRNTPLALSAGMALANDSDPNGNPFAIVSYTPPAHGRIIRTGPVMGYYIPNAGFVGTDTATYTIRDSTGATDTATLTFDVHR